MVDTSENDKERECDENLEILVADKAGFCLGVERALNMVLSTILRKGARMYTYGPLIHNAQVVDYLDSLGVKEVDRIKTSRRAAGL